MLLTLSFLRGLCLRLRGGRGPLLGPDLVLVIEGSESAFQRFVHRSLVRPMSYQLSGALNTKGRNGLNGLHRFVWPILPVSPFPV